MPMRSYHIAAAPVVKPYAIDSGRAVKFALYLSAALTVGIVLLYR